MKSENLNFTGQLCNISLFRNVQNPSEIREKLLKGKIDATIINAALIPDVLQVFVAANKAAKSYQNGKSLTKTVHTEVLYNLSPTRKVTDSLKTFGIGDQTSDFIVVTFEDENGEKFQNLKNLVQGEVRDLSELNEITNWSEIAKLHGIDTNLDHQQIKDLLTSKTAVKDLLL